MTNRPAISSISTSAELRRWYWLKTELVDEARRRGIKRSGAKFTILERLCHYLDTGEKPPAETTPKTPRSKFDWHTETLSAETVITNSYKNTQNVRRFFKAHINETFKFNIEFMEWIKKNNGKTLGDAAAFWVKQQASQKKTTIKPHNQFNQYCRDFMEDNPTLGMKDARSAWARKKSLPSDSGRHVYEPGDWVPSEKE